MKIKNPKKERKKISKIDNIKTNNKGSAIVVSLLVLSLVVIIIVSVSSIYVNKVQSLKNINDYYDKLITNKLDSR
ncbi:hypothetical protein HZY83_00700 [Gemella sp. GH3]|uniref:hypothetical protein n=1 Tax=unclassified Gemella TaxID=2624949 RepID=UPI0015D09535|nr:MULTISPECIES: hypothetical protein [unclassified Gemella]MBF0713229.1 hypothetical protein [Gemella sp. GH3.1]NYS50181.1 hypothetical protein [Gemella sp. GH3]